MIRRATVEDAVAVALVHRRARLEAYAGFMDPEAIAGDPLEDAVAQWRPRLRAPEVTTLVWESAGMIGGFASVGPGVDEEPLDPEVVGKLWALYVDPTAQGAGVGRSLLEAAEADMRDRGRAEAVLWAYVRNERALRFYERAGWVAEPDITAGEGAEAEIRYRRSL